MESEEKPKRVFVNLIEMILCSMRGGGIMY